MVVIDNGEADVEVQDKYLFVYGGAAQDQSVAPDAPYGNIVIDHSDIYILDVETMIWFKAKKSFIPSGVHAITVLDDNHVLLTGGMYSEKDSDTPTWLDRTEVITWKF